jgi:hypothetical protein
MYEQLIEIPTVLKTAVKGAGKTVAKTFKVSDEPTTELPVKVLETIVNTIQSAGETIPRQLPQPRL